jgi:hypothetical protein
MGLTQSTIIDINKHNILLELRYNIFMNELQKLHDNKIKELNDKIENLDDKIKKLEFRR